MQYRCMASSGTVHSAQREVSSTDFSTQTPGRCYFAKGPSIFIVTRLATSSGHSPWPEVPGTWSAVFLQAAWSPLRDLPSYPHCHLSEAPRASCWAGTLMCPRISASSLHVQHICILMRSSIHFSLASLPCDHAPADGVLSATGSVYVNATREPGQVVPVEGAHGLSLRASQH